MNQDDKIVAGILKKDQKAFQLLVDEYGGLIWSIVKFHLSVLSPIRKNAEMIFCFPSGRI